MLFAPSQKKPTVSSFPVNQKIVSKFYAYVYYTCILYNVILFCFSFVDELAIQVACSPRDFATYAGCEYKQKIMFSKFFVTSYIELWVQVSTLLVSMSSRKQWWAVMSSDEYVLIWSMFATLIQGPFGEVEPQIMLLC
jgi:hypothetical protein